MYFYLDANFFIEIYDLNIDKNIKMYIILLIKMLGVFYEEIYYFLNYSIGFNYSMFK